MINQSKILKNDQDYTDFLLGQFLDSDPDAFKFLEKEKHRQKNQIELIASENFVSPAVLCALGSIFTNKYAEGYPAARYYGGCENMDEVENLAIQRICKLFECQFANVQPHSGASANLAAFYAFLKPGDLFIGMDLAAGGHLTHGAKPTVSGKWFQGISYGVDPESGLIDYDSLMKLAHHHKPKLIIAGASSYSRQIDFKKFREIADSVGAILMADVAHYAGLIAAKEYESPFPYADVVTTTTHKTLRGPRGGLILWNNPEYSRKINSAVFPGIQGGPLMNVILAKAVAFNECLKEDFKVYAKNVIKNARALAKSLENAGLKIVSGGTDCHLLSANVFEKFGITGFEAEKILDLIGITCNKNAVPFDKLSFKETSGIRLGSAAETTRGLNESDFDQIGKLICSLLNEQSLIKKNKGFICLENEFKKNASLKIKEILKKHHF